MGQVESSLYTTVQNGSKHYYAEKNDFLPMSQNETAKNLTQNQFAHEAMLLSHGKMPKVKEIAIKQRASSQFRGHQLSVNEMMSNYSLMHTNMSQSTLVDSSRPVNQKRSLNFYVKKKEAERIDEQNAILMKRLQSTQVSPHLDNKNIRRQMEEIKKYKRTIQGTSNRHIDITPIIEKTRMRKAMLSEKKLVGPFPPHNARRLPPLTDNYQGSQIEEVSSARDSIIENETTMNVYQKEKSKHDPAKKAPIST